MTRLPHPSLSVLSACLAAAGLVAACGGNDDPAPATPAATTTTVSGSVVKGPVSSANVCAYKAVAAGKGEQISCTTTNASGAYTMNISYTGDVVLEATGGTYTDEATNTTKTLAEPMQVVVASQGGATTGVVTPLTSAAYSVSKGLSGGVTSGNFGTAATTVATQFQLSGVNLATTTPVVTGTTNAYGQILRAVAQFIANGNTQAAFQAFATPTTLQAGFGTAYATANGSSLTFTFNGGTTPVTPGGGTGTGGGTTGNKTLVVTVTASGTTSTVTVNNVPQPASQTEFCNGIQNDSTFKQATAGGGTLTIDSCSYSGNSGTVAATMRITSPVTISVPYTVQYTYQ